MTESPAMQAARRIFRPTNDQAVEQVADLIEALRYIAKTWPDSFAARHARAVIAKSTGAA